MFRLADIVERPVPWLGAMGLYHEVVLSSRVRIARNLIQSPFPNQSSSDDLDAIKTQVTNAVESIPESAGWECIPLGLYGQDERRLLIERRLISPYVGRNDHTLFFLDDDCRISLQVNERDHLRLQILDSGLELPFLWKEICPLVERLSAELDFAFDEQFGFLTASPQDAGSGARFSLMFFLPGLEFTGLLSDNLEGIVSRGYSLQGYYGDESDVIGSIFQIYNGLATDNSANHHLLGLLKIAHDLVDNELEARVRMFNDHRTEIEDRIFRSLGVIERAKKLSAKEFIRHFAYLRLGVLEKILTGIDLHALQELLLWTQGGHMALRLGEEPSSIQREVFRANLVRSHLGLS